MTPTDDLTRISPELRRLAGEQDAGTRMYRREGSGDETAEWFDELCVPLQALVSPGGAAAYAHVSRAGVYKWIKAGKLTAFCFHITKEKKTFFGGSKIVKRDPIVYISVPECQAWRKELEARVGRIRATKAMTEDDEKALEETDGEFTPEMHDLLKDDPKDKKAEERSEAVPVGGHEMSENDKLLSVRQVSEICTVSAREIWRDVSAHLFPQPVKLGPKTIRWWQSDVLKFLRGEWKP